MADWLLLKPVYWNWWLLGMILMVIEVLVPGTFFLWLGIAAFCVGLLLIPFPQLAWQLQWLIFALLAVGSIVAWRLYSKRYPMMSSDPLLNRRAQQYVGRVLTLDAPIVNGQGRSRVDDTTWKVTGADCPAGTRVRVVGTDGIALKVEIEPGRSSQPA